MKLIKIKEIAVVITGHPFKGELYSDNGIRVVRGENVTEGALRWDTEKCWDLSFDKAEEYSLKHNDIVIGMDGSKVGKNKARIDKNDLPLLLAQRVACLRAKQGTDQLFLYYNINNPQFEQYVFKTQTGSSIPHISKTQIEEFKIPEVKYNDQIKIGKVLSDLDSKIELNNKINAELEAMAKTIYDYWFVQFDFPISKEQAKAMGKPKLEGKPYKSSGGRMVWNEDLKREIPEGWEVGPMGDWITVNKSGDWGKEVIDGNYQTKVNCIRGTDINGINGLEQCNPPTRYILEKNVNKILEAGDLIVEISGGSPTQSTGRLALISEETLLRFENPIICSNFCKPVTIKNKKYLYNFAYYWNNLYANGIFFGYEGKTSGIKNFLFDSFVSSYLTTKPDEKTVSKFYDFMSLIHAKKQTALKENQELASLRDWLLPMLMNGQVKVGNGD